MTSVLVLEDDPGNMQAFCAILSSLGYRVLEATSGEEAIETSNKHEPLNVFVSDIALTDLSGTEVALRLIPLQPDLRILFLSGTPIDYWTPRDQWNFRQLPPDSEEFLEKPFRASALQAKVESLVNRHSSAAGARR
jgi:CheY-like chemotaxis protein